MANLRLTLANISSSITNRDNLIASAKKKPEEWFPLAAENRAYRAWASCQDRIYQALIRKVDAAASNVPRQVEQIDAWEVTAAGLENGTKCASEVVDERGEWDSEKYREVPGVFKEGWGWEQEVGSGPGVEDVVDPLDAGNKNTEEIEEGANYGERSRGEFLGFR